MAQSKPEITRTTHTLSFDKLSPRDFERLCLWLVEHEGYERAEHLGAAGSEQGRDIIAWREGKLCAFQCKRVQRFGPKSALAEVEKVLALPEDQRPVEFVFIVTCDVSANTRHQAREHCTGEMECHFWASTELDEKVKRHSDIVEEFFQVRPISTPEITFTVPFPRNPDFVGREEDLARLHEMIHQGESPACDERSRIVGIRPTVLVGLGGIGKTQLAVEYAHAHRDDYPGGIFWLNAVNPLLHEFADLAETLGLADRETPHDQAARQAWAYLDAHPDALVVFDNVAEPADLNVPFVPGLISANLRCRTLFTTRQCDFPRNFQPFEVKVLPEMAAMRLLLRARPEVLEEHHPEWGVARIVCASLGWLPLALELAAAYLGEYAEVTLEGYLERLRAEGRLTTVDDTELRPEDLPTRHEAAVAATLCTQWARLDEEEDKDARLLLRAAGQFPEAAWIPTARLGLLVGVEARAEPGRTAPLTRALNKLRVVSLVEQLSGDRLRLHPLVQEFATGLSAAAFRAEMAAHLAAALGDVLSLEAQVVRRGIDAVVEDLRTGLWLCSAGAAAETTRVQLTALERLLDREAHALRAWDPAALPAYFLQQVAGRARMLELAGLTTAAEALLADQKCPRLRLRWWTGRESPALLRVLAGHTLPVFAVAVTPDGRRAVSGSADDTLRVWDLETGREEYTLAGHANGVNAVAVTPDGRRAVSGSEDKTLRVWDLETGREERALAGHTSSVYAVAVTPDGRRAVSGSADDTLRVWDLKTGREERTLTGHANGVSAVAVTPDGRWAVSGAGDHTLRVWDLETGREERTLAGHTSSVFAVAVTPDGRRAVSGAGDHTLRVWDLKTGREERTLVGHTNDVFAVAVTMDGRRAVSGAEDHTLRVWDLETGREEYALEESNWLVQAVAVTPDGRRAVLGLWDRTLCVWDLEMGREERTLAGHTSSVFAMSVTPDGRRAVSGSWDKTLRVWELETGQEEYMLEGHTSPVFAVAVTPNGRWAVSGSEDNTLRVWDLETGREEYTLEGHTSSVFAVAVTPDGRRAVSGSRDKTLRVWDLGMGREECALAGHTSCAWAVAVTPDGQRAVLGLEDYTLRMWDLETGQEERTLEGHTSLVIAVAVTPDGRRAVSGSRDETLRVWDLEMGREERTLEGHTDDVNAVAVTPDGRRVVSGSEDHTLRVWDLETGRELACFSAEAAILAFALTPDGRVVAGDRAGNVYCLQYVE